MFIELLKIGMIGVGLFAAWLIPNAIALAATEYEGLFVRIGAHILAHIPLVIIFGATLELFGVI